MGKNNCVNKCLICIHNPPDRACDIRSKYLWLPTDSSFADFKIQTQCALLSRYESIHLISGLWLMAQLGLGLCETVHIYGETSPSMNTRPNTSCPSETYVTSTRGERVQFLLM
jgi:hypothetical protein